MDLEIVELVDWHRSLRNLLDHLELELVFADVGEGDLRLVDLADQELAHLLDCGDCVVRFVVGVFFVRIVELLRDDDIQVERISSLLLHFFYQHEEILGAGDLQVLLDGLGSERPLVEREVGESHRIDDSVVALARVDEVLTQNLVPLA